MANLKVMVFTPEGETAGYFLNPKIEMMPPHHYKVVGTFYDHLGELPHRIEFNPQVLPYLMDISAVSACSHQKLTAVYIQRSRQPVEMIGTCDTDEAVLNY